MRGYRVLLLFAFSTPCQGMIPKRAQKRAAILAAQIAPHACRAHAARMDQTEAYFRVISEQQIDAALNKLQVARYRDFFKKITEVGRAHPEHYYFVHGYNKDLCALHDFYTLLHEKIGKQYAGLRKASDLHEQYIPEYLHEHKGKINDGCDPYKKQLLSVNLSAVGNLHHGESSYAYAMGNHSWIIPDGLEAAYLADLDPRITGHLGLYVYTRLKEIASILEAQEGAMMQILIPRSTVDKYAYISAAGGKAWNEKIRLTDGSVLEDGWDDTLHCYTRIQPLLELYTTHPELLKEYMPKGQARLVMHKDFLDEASGIKFVRHLTVNDAAIEKYWRELRKLVWEVVQMLESKTVPDQTEAMQKIMQLNLRESVILMSFYGCAELILEAKVGIKDCDARVRWDAIGLFNTVVELGHGIQEAIQAARVGIKDSDGDVRCRSLRLFKSLVEKGHGIQEAIQAAFDGVQEKSFFLRYIAIKLFQFLVKNGYGIQEAMQAAQTGVQNSFGGARNDGLELFKVLIENDHGIQEAIQAAQVGIKDSVQYVRKTAFELFESLVKKGHGIQEAIQAALVGIKDSDANARSRAIELFKVLVAEGHDFAEAIQAAQQKITKDL